MNTQVEFDDDLNHCGLDEILYRKTKSKKRTHTCIPVLKSDFQMQVNFAAENRYFLEACKLRERIEKLESQIINLKREYSVLLAQRQNIESESVVQWAQLACRMARLVEEQRFSSSIYISTAANDVLYDYEKLINYKNKE